MRWRLNKERLLWLRVQKGWSQEETATRARIYNKRQYIRLEDGETLQPRRDTLEGLAAAFGLVDIGELQLRADEAPTADHVTTYLHYKNAPSGDKPLQRSTNERADARAPFDLIAMDVDGTILQGIEYSWKVVWRYLNLPDERRQLAMRRFLTGKLTYAEWCNYCCVAFAENGLTRDDFDRMIQGVSVIANFRSEASRLRSRGIKLAIISGGIDAFLEAGFPDYRDYFDFVFINVAVFSKSGKLARIDPTPYDFAGKVDAVDHLCSVLGTTRERVVFIGEGLNDRFMAAKVGLTIALCPHSQDVREGFDVVVSEPDFSLVSAEILQDRRAAG